jgi:HNH endonuclease
MPVAQGLDNIDAKGARRFWSKVSRGGPDECWLWHGGTFTDGYGVFNYHSKNYLAHRVAYAIANGSTPDGLLVCHSCDTKLCVNPRHLFVGRQRDNVQDMELKGRRGLRKSQFTQAQVDEMCSLRSRGWTYTSIGARYGVTKSTANRLINGWFRVSESNDA